MTIPYIVGRDAITVMVDGATHTVGRDHLNYEMIREAIRVKDWDAVPSLLTPAAAVDAFGKGVITVRNGEVLYHGTPLHNSVATRIVEMTREGFDAEPLINFLVKLMDNPSKSAVDELYDWLERTSLPITEDGDFLAYKKVRDDYLDYYTGKMLNSVGEEPSMPRNQVDDNRSRTCSQGLHFCSLSYLPSYHGGNGRVMIVKINPANVVSIPNDYNFAKGRAWTYKVIGEHTSEAEEAFDTPVATNDGAPIGAPRRTANNSAVVMGINWGSEGRARMVQELVNRVGAGTGSDSRSVEQGRMDGFDDAFDERDPSLHRLTGGMIREAVAYAQAYFQGYDRCSVNANTPAAAAPVTESRSADEFEYENSSQKAEIERVMKLRLLHNRHSKIDGYYDGKIDGQRARRGNGYTQTFDLSTAQEGGRGYRQGYIVGYLAGYNG